MNTTKTVTTENEVTRMMTNVAMDARDFKIFSAMLANLESFVKDADKKAANLIGPRYYISWHIEREKTQHEKDVSDLDEMLAEFIDDENMRLAKVLGPIIERLKGKV